MLELELKLTISNQNMYLKIYINIIYIISYRYCYFTMQFIFNPYWEFGYYSFMRFQISLGQQIRYIIQCALLGRNIALNLRKSVY